ncbi:MAG: nickel pincer cofactor biosynthesis protein LarC [Nitrososphaeraceae archaeon]
MNRITVIDSQISGISGDMFLSCLIDLGANKKKVIDGIFECQDIILGCCIKEARFEKIEKNGFNATRFFFQYEDRVLERRGNEMQKNLEKLCEKVKLKQNYKSYALNVLKTLINVESRIHGKKTKNVYLHEIGSLDTFVDIIGSSIALQELNILDSKIQSTNVNVGNGIIKFSHGTISNPTNGVLEIFKGKNIVINGSENGELTTPTGASILVNLTNDCIEHYPKMIPKKIGLGAGEKEFKNHPNVLRIVLGDIIKNYSIESEPTFLIETNVDDISGEVVGNLINVLMKEGAKDVTIFPGISKKNRPIYSIRVISDKIHMNNLIDKLFKESGTGGIRIQETNRIVLPRNIITLPVLIDKREFKVRVKIIRDNMGNIINIKPEYDDLKKISTKMKMPFKLISDLIMPQISSNITIGG